MYLAVIRDAQKVFGVVEYLSGGISGCGKIHADVGTDISDAAPLPDFSKIDLEDGFAGLQDLLTRLRIKTSLCRRRNTGWVLCGTVDRLRVGNFLQLRN